MTLLEAIKSRHSVRKYIDKPIEETLVSILQEKVDEVNEKGGLHIQLVTNEPKAFKGKMAYGTFSGVTNYFAMIGKKGDDLSERIGYYGEQLVLLAETLGLNTCWVGLTYNNIKEAYEKYDFSAVFDDLADDCVWGGAHGKDAVIEKLTEGALSMKERNYWHKCTIVQVGKAVAPLECNTKPDGTGEKVMLGLLYNQGEICMIDATPRQTLFFRMTIAPNGKIREYYATLPSGDYHTIE